MNRRVHVRAASRLHFGLLSLPTAARDQRRYFGGAGLMIDVNPIGVRLEQAEQWSAEGTLAERTLQFARTYCDAASVPMAFHIQVDAAREHVGLGTGTQLGLAVARAIAALTGRPSDAVTLAQRVGRGARSALGVHGFDVGGFLVEGGKMKDRAISPLLIRQDFPADWKIMLIMPRGIIGLHGKPESEAFANLLQRQGADDRITNELCRLVLLGMLPALVEHDLPAFGEALYEFNRKSGEMFKSIQGGPYAHPRVAEIVGSIREAGINGVGQSSWGPTVFAIVAADQVSKIRERIVNQEDLDVLVTSACNHGAVLSTEY